MSCNTSSTNTTWQSMTVTRPHREKQNGHRGGVIWFTGLSGSGKSTLANAVEEVLHQQGCRTFVLDGDNVRHGLCADLGFSSKDRQENIRRIGEVARLFTEAGLIVLAAFISPFREDRERVRALFKSDEFIEVYCNADLAICEQRDVKGMYQKARAGIIHEFTGISSPYESPVQPELIIETGTMPLPQCVQQVVDAVSQKNINMALYMNKMQRDNHG